VSARSVVLAGLLAGLVLNVGEALLHGFVLAEATVEAMAALGREEGSSGAGLALLIGVTFAQGIVGVWLYASLLPRLKARGARAIVAGFVLWVLSALYSAIYLGAGLPSLMPIGVVWWPVAWAAVEYPLAIFVGSLAYRSAASPAV
jgi:hypothetical protein